MVSRAARGRGSTPESGKKRKTSGESGGLGKRKHPGKQEKAGKPVVSRAAWGRRSTAESRKKRETSGESGKRDVLKFPEKDGMLICK